jgi:hypothetical protein
MRNAIILCLLLNTLGNAQDSLSSPPVDSIAILREALANHKAYIADRVAIGTGFYTYYAIQGQKLGWGFLPKKEIEMAAKIGSETESSFRTARTLNWISLPVFWVGYGMFLYSYTVDRTYITFYDGNREYRGTGVPEDRGGFMAVGGVIGLTGIIGWATAFQIHKKALYHLDEDLRRHYGVE